VVRRGGKRPLVRPKRRREYNIKTDLQKVGRGDMDFMDLAEDREVTDCCGCGNETSGSIKCGEILD
jgi:hypothetical protein